MTKILLIAVSSMAMALSQMANAVPTVIGADRLLGTIVPSEPADEANEKVQVNGLLDGWGTVKGYNDGAASGTVMGDNPSDPNPPPKPEVYTLTYSTDTVIPTTAPLAATPWLRKETSNPVIDLGDYSYQWLVAKWGADAEVYYIGGMTGEIKLELISWSPTAHGLSHYTLFNQTKAVVPDGGATIAMLGLGLVGLGFLRRRKA